MELSVGPLKSRTGPLLESSDDGPTLTNVMSDGMHATVNAMLNLPLVHGHAQLAKFGGVRGISAWSLLRCSLFYF